jgi:endonuclease/exonuclease/phosphatase family metal-dependent hydrolase
VVQSSSGETPRRLEGVNPAPRPRADPRIVTILTWNIAWGYGWGSEGHGGKKPRSHFERALTRIGEVVGEIAADVALLQEVDFGSTRSHGIEEAEAIARTAGLPYVAEALSWRSAWVPYPYWPPREHFGRMRSGGAILSRHPIHAHRVELLPKPSANPFWYNFFYLFRYLQRAEIELADRRLLVFNTHLEAFDEANRIEHARRCKAIVEALLVPETVFAGDLNSVPPESPKKSHYPDEASNLTHHERDRTIEIVRSIRGLSDVISKEAFAANQAAYFTFPAHAPNRKLDYLFTGDALEVADARVVSEAGDVSDHLPLVAKLKLRARSA